MKLELGSKAMNCSNNLAKLFVKQSANSACAWMFHQPEFPEAAKQFKKLNDHK
ncbi:cyclic lactone autoinducer peptide [Anaerosporobacter faecicola]|uniref:cyclic lactone autoinducer peptide n=1 Tax=Anaerosporobacter faecicola TaxID=2718714 RepID=UPI00143A884F|nr:cyclic lactone autoinducer peptide [Anaerosporobacter faecicola]